MRGGERHYYSLKMSYVMCVLEKPVELSVIRKRNGFQILLTGKKNALRTPLSSSNSKEKKRQFFFRALSILLQLLL